MNYRLTLAHINDTHSHFDASLVRLKIQLNQTQFSLASHSGGYPRIAAQVQQLREQAAQQQQEMLFLHGGDSFHGTLFYSQFKGQANARVLDYLSPDAMVIGNHDIDDGNATLANFIAKVSFPVMAANMDLSAEAADKVGALAPLPNLLKFDNAQGIGQYLLKPFYNTQLAIIGVTLDQMKRVARPDADTEFLPAFETVANTIKHLKQQGVHHIIVLSHLGYEMDKHLAAEVDGISVIVGGHTHTLMGDFTEFGLPCVPYGETVNGVPVLQAGKHAEALGIAELEFDALGKVTQLSGSSCLMLDRHFLLSGDTAATEQDYRDATELLHQHPGILWDEQDEQLKAIIDHEFRPAVSSMEQQVLAMVPRTLAHTRLPSQRLPHGSEIAPLVSQSMFLAAREQLPSLHFALHNAGGVRQSLEQGQVTLGDIMGRLLPFDLPLVCYEIQGVHLKQVLESAINEATNNSVMGTGAGSFPYTHRLRYFYDGRQPMGERIVKLELLKDDGCWYEIVTEEYYVGVSTSYTTSGKEGYDALLNAEWQQSLEHVTLPGAFIRMLSHDDILLEPAMPTVNYISHRNS
ncbi:bifunctional metallophosphatase/5'-nucleotidase [Shewanella avicenniae]|uniref:Bifunctional metallophosphatase/5'-nucleotidase n=1 Tax=Shewanella avicenniae TaxID=2814294 RepID=A0ABX7QTM4_9GAMM|nr:bifunctional metallophosphatase/5'-nucleotidase [Shewanella avicenniae]QSX34833.1 bifunctional metallophosphatase/5'-nucleotidase [Shewanella avicenniae]